MSTQPIPIFPITASVDGKRNAFTHACAFVGHSRHYATCLHIADAEKPKSEHFKTLYADCLTAVRKGQCPAVDMRAKEIEAGKALYFKERIVYMGQKLIDAAFNVLSFSRSPATDKEVNIKPHKNVASKPSKSKSAVSKKSDNVDTGDYADAVNFAIAKEQAQKQGKPVIVATQQPSEKPSLMELAKQMLAQKGNK